MRKVLAQKSGVFRVLLLQLAVSTFLVIFLSKVLIRNINSNVMLLALFYVSSDHYAFDIIIELVQMSLFVPVMIFIMIKVIKQFDMDNAYLIIRHKMSRIWFWRLLVNIITLSLTTAIATMTVFYVYTRYALNETTDFSLTDLMIFSLSLTCGVVFYILLSLTLSLNKSALFTAGTQISLLAIGRILIHSVHEIASLTIVAAININHMFIPSDETGFGQRSIKQIILIYTVDFIVIFVVSLLFQYSVKRINLLRGQTC